MTPSDVCHLCGKPAYGAVKSKSGVPLAICLAHYIELQGVENERQKNAEAAIRHNMAMMNLASDEMAAITGFAQPTIRIPQPAPASSYTAISVSNSTVGVINTASVQQITSSVNSLPSEDPARKALIDFTSAVTSSTVLTDDGKKELLDLLTVVADQAAEPPEKRKRSVVIPLLDTLAKGSQTISGLAGAWTAIEPILKGHFGL